MAKPSQIVFIFLLFLFSALILLFKVDKSFDGHHDFNNAFYGNMARNLTRYPPLNTYLAQPTNPGRSDPTKLSFHTHHPPLLVWSLALSYLLFGISEISTRIVAVIFSLGTLVIFYLLVKRTVNPKVAIIAVTFWAITPIYIYFGKMAVQEIPVLFFAILGLYAYSVNSRIILYFASVLAFLSGWPGYYLVPVIFLWEYWRKHTIRKEILILPLLAVFTFSFHLLQNQLTTGSIIGSGFANSFLLRTSNIPIIEYFKKELSWLFAYFSKPLVTISIIGVILSIIKKQKIITIFIFFGILHLLIFRQAAFRHDYLIYYLLPGVALGAAYFLEGIFQKKRFLLAASSFSVVILITLTSMKFTQALLASNYGKSAVIAGKQIAKNTAKNAKVTLVDKEIYNNFDWQVVFYADRHVTVVPK